MDWESEALDMLCSVESEFSELVSLVADAVAQANGATVVGQEHVREAAVIIMRRRDAKKIIDQLKALGGPGAGGRVPEGPPV